MIYAKGIIIFIIASICCFLYGLYNVFNEVEKNACRMTYMFEEPRYAPIKLKSNVNNTRYGLYYYYESHRHLDARKFKFNGAPVIFVPGNAGSYKQVRSLASVALRKAQGSGYSVHLDYFTVDFNEELSAFYGGYLFSQKNFLIHCIEAVLKLYKSTTKLVLIGHSMGGKIAQSVLTVDEISRHINTIICLSTPMDEPVLNLDKHINNFYTQTNKKLHLKRTAIMIHNQTNACSCQYQHAGREVQLENQQFSRSLDNILIVTTGGGNRDLLVRSGLTTSIFTDVHAMTSAIPKVGLSCDHLSAVWCLQFMLVINRFLFSIATKNGHVTFSDSKIKKLQMAVHYFVKPRQPQRANHKPRMYGTFQREERKFIFSKHFNALPNGFNQLINIKRDAKYKKLYIEVYGADDHDWLYGYNAAAHDDAIDNKHASSLIHHIQRLEHGINERYFALLDLHNLQRTYDNLTQVLIQLPISKYPIGFHVDIYNPSERVLDIKMPHWYNLYKKPLIVETMQGTMHYKIRITDLIDPYQALTIFIEPRACKNQAHTIMTKLCIPWVAGYEQTLGLNATTQENIVHLGVPTSKPRFYNTTINPVILDIYLDPLCRYSINYQYAFHVSMSRLVHIYFPWLLANVIIVFILVLKNQIGIFLREGTFKSLKPYTGYFQYKSLCLVVACRIIKKLLSMQQFLPQPEQLSNSLLITFVIHSTAIAISLLAVFSCWGFLVFNGNLLLNLLLRVTRLNEALSNLMITTITYLPLTFGVVTISIAISTSSGIGLFIASVIYFLLLSNSYKDYLEDLLLQKAANAFKNASGLDGTKTNDETINENTNDSSDETEKNEESDELNEDADPSVCVGLKNISFHVTLFLLLCVMTVINSGNAIAWHKTRRFYGISRDPNITSCIITLICLTFLLQMKAPRKLIGYRAINYSLYVLAIISYLYCQSAIYLQNIIITCIFVLVTLHEIGTAV